MERPGEKGGIDGGRPALYFQKAITESDHGDHGPITRPITPITNDSDSDSQTDHAADHGDHGTDHETGGLSIVNNSNQPGLEGAWLSTHHTSNFVPVFATGPGADYFDGLLDNTDIGQQLITMILAD